MAIYVKRFCAPGRNVRKAADPALFCCGCGVEPRLSHCSQKCCKAVQIGTKGCQLLRLGFLLQDAAMIPCFTVKENMLHSMRLRGDPGSLKQKLSRIRDAVAEMSKLDFLREPPLALPMETAL